MTDRELDRRAAHRLAVIRHAQEVTGNVSKTCRYYGITRQAYYKWLRRYEAGGVAALRDGSPRPHTSPNATQAEVVGKIVYLRQTYHFGPHKIAMYLERYHELRLSPSGIWRILRRLDMSRLPASQRYRRHTDRWKRYERPRPTTVPSSSRASTTTCSTGGSATSTSGRRRPGSTARSSVRTGSTPASSTSSSTAS